MLGLVSTGDNLLTAVSVARECGMVPPGHRAVMLRARLSPLGLPSVTYHLLGEGRDHSHLLASQIIGECVSEREGTI